MASPSNPTSYLPLANLGFNVLVALAAEDRHGYGIIKDIEERTQGMISIRSGALYTTIQRLLETGFVEPAPTPGDSDGDARRKYYRITPLGRQVATLEAARLGELVDAARQRRLVPGEETG